MQQWLTTGGHLCPHVLRRFTDGNRQREGARHYPLVAPRADDLPLVVASDQLSRPAMRLTEPATITTPNRYDKKAWESTVPRMRGSRMVVSDTW